MKNIFTIGYIEGTHGVFTIATDMERQEVLEKAIYIEFSLERVVDDVSYSVNEEIAPVFLKHYDCELLTDKQKIEGSEFIDLYYEREFCRTINDFNVIQKHFNEEISNDVNDYMYSIRDKFSNSNIASAIYKRASRSIKKSICSYSKEKHIFGEFKEDEINFDEQSSVCSYISFLNSFYENEIHRFPKDKDYSAEFVAPLHNIHAKITITVDSKIIIELL